MALLCNRVGQNSMNLVGPTCDLVRKLLMVSMQKQVYSLCICTRILNEVCHLYCMCKNAYVVRDNFVVSMVTCNMQSQATVAALWDASTLAFTYTQPF